MTDRPTGSTQQLRSRLDGSSREWLERLRSQGADRTAAIGELHELLVRAASFEINRRRASLVRLHGGDLADLAQQSADDALVAILAKLDDFRGDARFTTWAYKFALYEAAASVRKRAWQGREIPLDADAWPPATDGRPGPGHKAETNELLSALAQEIDLLSPHQREVLVALALNEVPIDVLAQRLSTTRGALYKTLHDARRKLRSRLTTRGLSLPEHGDHQ